MFPLTFHFRYIDIYTNKFNWPSYDLKLKKIDTDKCKNNFSSVYILKKRNHNYSIITNTESNKIFWK